MLLGGVIQQQKKVKRVRKKGQVDWGEGNTNGEFGNTLSSGEVTGETVTVVITGEGKMRGGLKGYWAIAEKWQWMNESLSLLSLCKAPLNNRLQLCLTFFPCTLLPSGVVLGFIRSLPTLTKVKTLPSLKQHQSKRILFLLFQRELQCYHKKKQMNPEGSTSWLSLGKQEEFLPQVQIQAYS